MQCEHDDKKMNKAGEKCSNKNSFGNPKNPNMCLFLSRATCVSMNSEDLGEIFFVNVFRKQSR